MGFFAASAHPRQHSIQQCPLAGKAARYQNSARKILTFLGNQQITKQYHKASSILKILKSEP